MLRRGISTCFVYGRIAQSFSCSLEVYMAYLPVLNYLRHGLITVFFNIEIVNSVAVDLESIEITEVFIQPNNFVNIKLKLDNGGVEHTVVNSSEPASVADLYEIDLNTLKYLEVAISSGEARKSIVFKKELTEFIELDSAESDDYIAQTYQSSFLLSQKYCYNHLSFFEELTI